MKNCKYCGAQLADDDEYCYFCGKPVEEEKQEAKEPYFNYSNNGYREGYNDNYIDGPRNGIAMAGFVIAFFSPIAGLILSSFGLKKARMLNGTGRGYAVAGIVISIINFILSFALYALYYSMYYGEE